MSDSGKQTGDCRHCVKTYYLEVVNRQSGSRRPCGDSSGYRSKGEAVKAAKALYGRMRLAKTDGDYIRVMDHVGSIDLLTRAIGLGIE